MLLYGILVSLQAPKLEETVLILLFLLVALDKSTGIWKTSIAYKMCIWKDVCVICVDQDINFTHIFVFDVVKELFILDITT